MLTKNDLKQIENTTSKIIGREVKNLATKGDIKPIKSDIAKIRKDIDVMLSMFDREYVELRRRIERVEEHLNLPPFPTQI